ncbi:integrase catalytic domain-containing protein [Trichonephila clavipes]|nr:integrase catalytic domain-containing protein [Trichonephila clavipes]
MWTDSTIALAWIKTEPHKLKTFVSNRVTEIQTLSKDCHWKYVSSRNNPADLISRGCNVDELLKNEMWFSGPDLQTDEYEDNKFFPDPSYRDELKCAVTLSITEFSSNFYDELFNVTNNFIKLIRIFSFIFRFINNIKAKESRNKEKYLTADEIKRSTEFLAKIAQLSDFKAEIGALKKGKGVSKTSKLKALELFLDENSLLRVGGRFSNADLPFEAQLQNRFIKLICSKNETLANYFASEAIQWKYIPPRSPNFGGLWEARQRNKWQFEKNNVAVGCLVLLKENDLPPCKWAMARILKVIYGTDARCKKPHTIAEELILPAAIEIVETMFGGNFAKELQSIPLSNDTVSRRIDDIAEDVEQQLFGKLRDKLFSIQLDEATDSNKDAHFIAYVRFWDAARELLTTDHVILNHGQVTWTTPELAPLSPNYHTTPTGGRFSSRQTGTPSGTGLELVTRQATIRYLYHSATVAKFSNKKLFIKYLLQY